jgi:hypothetical protein
MLKRLILTCCLLAGASYAQTQTWYVGAGGGYGFAPKLTISGLTPDAKTGFDNGGALGAFFGEDSHKFWSGEVHYLHRWDNLSLSSGGATAKFGGHSDILHADFLRSFTPRGSKVRPFIALGGGARFLAGTGTESATQPLGNYAALTATRETLAVIDAAFGVRAKLGKSAEIRFEVRDYMSPAPKQVIAPAPGASLGGWFNDIVASVSIGYRF